MTDARALLRSLSATALLAAVACGDTSSEPERTSIDGEVFDRAMSAQSVIWGISPFYGFVETRFLADHYAVKISDFEDSCMARDDEGVPGQSVYMDFFPGGTPMGPALSAPGAFGAWLPAIDGDLSTVPTGPFVVVTYADPSHGRGSVAREGSVTLTHLSSERIAGRFDVVFASGALSGSFDSVVFCDPWTSFSAIP